MLKRRHCSRLHQLGAVARLQANGVCPQTADLPEQELKIDARGKLAYCSEHQTRTA